VSNKAIHAFGTILKMGDGSGPPEVFATVAELKSVPIPQMERPRIDVSSHDNAGFVREYVGNLSDLQAINFEINYLPHDPTHDHVTGLWAAQIAGVKKNFKVFLNSRVTPPVVLNFPAEVTAFRPNAPVDNVYTAQVTLQPSAAPTFTSS
jgi:hypothetical protein